jgi:hypothetical protein
MKTAMGFTMALAPLVWQMPMPRIDHATTEC